MRPSFAELVETTLLLLNENPLLLTGPAILTRKPMLPLGLLEILSIALIDLQEGGWQLGDFG